MRHPVRLGSILTAIAVVGILLIPTQWAATTLATTPSTSDLALSLTAPAFVDRGSVFTDTVTLTNLGPSDAHAIVVTIKPMAGLKFQSSGSYPTCSFDGVRITCSVSSIANSSVLAIPVNFATLYQDACTAVTYTADVSVQANELDPALAGNSKTFSTAINCTAAHNECNDGIDNDKDGLIDMADPGCQIGSTEGADEAQRQMQIDQERRQMRILSHMGVLSSSSSSSVSRFPVQSVTIVPPQVTSSSQDAILTLTSSRNEVLPGDTVVLSAQAQNISSGTLKGVEVDFYYDPNQITPLATAGAMVGNGRLTWTVDLAPGEVRELSFSVRANASLKPGSTVAASMRILGAGGYPSSVLSMPVMGQLPQTGAGFLSSTDDASRFLSPIGSGSSVLVLLVIFSALKYTVAGGLVLRKFLAVR